MLLLFLAGICCVIICIQAYFQRNVYDREGEREKGQYPTLYGKR